MFPLLSRARAIFSIAFVFGLVLVSACSLKTPMAKSPPPNEQEQKKDFFVKTVKKDGKTVEESRLFECAWAPVSESGFLAEWYITHAATTTDHCNIVFHIEQDTLIGLQVDPSVDPKDWKTILTIPIKHFKRVHAQDSKGRDTKDWINKTEEDHWSQLTDIALDVKGTQIHDWSFGLLDGEATVLSAEDIEFTQHNGKNYFAFTLSVSSPYYKSYMQAKYRFNFLEFEHDEKFIPTPYKDQNSKYLNILHILGKRFQAEYPSLYSARWDTSGGDHSIEVCLFGFPNKYKKMAVDVINDWNDALASIGQPKAFWINTNRRLDFSMDLRCPTIVWVQDPRIIRNSPLGIGQVSADVRNGKILWGQIVIYGGAFEKYAKAFSPSDFASSLAEGDTRPFPWKHALDNPFQFKKDFDYFISDEHISKYGSAETQKKLYSALLALEMKHDLGFRAMEDLMFSSGAVASRMINDYFTSLDNLVSVDTPDNVRKLIDGAKGLISSYPRILDKNERLLQYLAYQDAEKKIFLNDSRRGISTKEDIANYFNKTSQEMQNNLLERSQVEKAMTKDEFARNPLSSILMGKNTQLNEVEQEERAMTAEMQRMSQVERSEYMASKTKDIVAKKFHTTVWDLDRTIADEAIGWHEVSPKILDKKTFPERVLIMIKRTLAHEFGHFLGVGHNFEENILPKKGSIPDAYYKVAFDNAKKYNSALTTVMGYDNPNVELSTDYNDIKPGPHDKMVLRYIYNKEYMTWNGKDKDFTPIPLPSDGEIPENNPDDESYVTSYYPACNDYTASLALDPFCSRHDLGYDAATLMDGYFESLDKNWLANINNYADASEAPEWAVFRWIWSRSFSTFAKVRHFYDYMVTKYADELASIATNSDNLYGFYKTCAGIEENKAIADVLNKADPELKQLCVKNGEAINKLSSYLQQQGPDFSEMDHNDWWVSSSITGGDAQLNYSRMWGTWTRLGLIPVKYSALVTLTSPYPYVYSSYNWMWPVYRYSRPGKEYRNLYSTFYPELFTKAIASTVDSNLKFKNSGAYSNYMGRSVLALGWFLDDLQYSNEVHRGIDPDYLDDIRKQTQFNLDRGGYVAIVLKTVKRSGDAAEADRVVGFNASMFDFGTWEMIPLSAAYVLPDAKIVFTSTDQKSFMYPVTDLMFYKDDAAYALAIRVTFTEDDKSSLWTQSVKVALRQQYNQVLSTCLVGTEKNGEKNGLTDFFSVSNEKEFRGFRVLPDIAGNSSRFKVFKDSIKEEFDKYWNNERYKKAKNEPDQNACKESLHGIGLVVTSAVALQGWWLPEITRYYIH